jgi:peptidoglycan/xylan/chitin deacetylase (PgdA/CDA1 family)
MTASTPPEPTYAQYARLRLGGLRGAARGAALTTLAAAAKFTRQTDRALTRPRVQFIFLHHVLRDEVAGFRRMLADLARDHTFVSHSDAVARVRDGRIDKPYLSFSWDDGFADNVLAARMLEEFGTTGCFFVCPGIVGERDVGKLSAFCERRLIFPLVTNFMTWDDMEKLLSRGHEIGGHTMTHPSLGELPAAQAEDEVARSYEQINHRLGKVEHFAWPHGRWVNFSPAAREAVFRAGFTSCASAVRGCHVTASGPDPAALCVRRDHVFAKWPMHHVRYLLARNARASSSADNQWPEEYRRQAA